MEDLDYRASYDIEAKFHISLMYSEFKRYAEIDGDLKPKDLTDWLEIQENFLTYEKDYGI